MERRSDRGAEWSGQHDFAWRAFQSSVKWICLYPCDFTLIFCKFVLYTTVLWYPTMKYYKVNNPAWNLLSRLLTEPLLWTNLNPRDFCVKLVWHLATPPSTTAWIFQDRVRQGKQNIDCAQSFVQDKDCSKGSNFIPKYWSQRGQRGPT